MAKIIKVKSDLKNNKNKSFMFALMSFTFTGIFLLFGIGLIVLILLKKISLPIIFPVLFIILSLLLLVVYFILRKKFDILNAGVKGEKTVLDILKHLPKNYTVITNPIINSRGKSYELDFAVVSPNGIYIVETKNYNGLIEGKTAEQKWRQIKYGKNDKKYEKEVNNPVRQVKRQKDKMRELFIDLGINIDIFPIVYFSGGNSKLHIVDDAEFNIPIIKRETELIKYIESNSGKKSLSISKYNKIVRVLKNS